jgi:serine/threonine-protein kinase
LTQPARARFGAYEILHELKSGGMGSVLLARRRGPGAFEQLVAIKTILPEYAAAPAVRAMFLDEAAILARTHHPGIATVHDFGEEGATLYMAMEYVAGISMRDVIEYRPPPIVLARAIVEACRGLHAAHELRDLSGAPLGLVHRDISPDNRMLGFDGHVKVIDFGIALIKNRQAPVTEFGSVKGKPPYMSPEQVKNEPLDRRSDVFSLGVVLWELLTQKLLFRGDSIYAVAMAVQEQVITPPSQVVGAPLPRGLDAVVLRALERDLARRTRTAADLAEQLEEVIQTAGGETLEAWAARVLAGARDDHRAWLASIVAGTALPKAVGRATGQATEVGPMAKGPTALAPIPAVAPLVAESPTPTSIGRDDDEDGLSIPPRRKLAPLVIALLVLLVLGGGAFVVLHSHGEAPVPRDASVPMDAHAVVPVAVDAAPLDAGIDAAVLVPVDAGTRHAVVRVRPDAGVTMTVKPDAAVATPPPAGTGYVTILYKPGPYANISIDDGPALPGPIFKRKVTAGRHTIKFLDPRSGDVLDTQAVEVTDGDVAKVQQR